MLVRRFDLNVEMVLQDWDVHHGVREIIANAIDEQALTGTKDIEIAKKGEKRFSIRDYGRGLKYEHLTQNEDAEKAAAHGRVIGKFGVGLKDALATFDRHGVGVSIKTRHGDIALDRSPKHEFQDVITLHAVISSPSDPLMDGTEVVLDGCADAEIAEAKSLFLRFSGDRVLERTQYGEILEVKSPARAKSMAPISPMPDGEAASARIYVHGVEVAKESNFLFSYNITSLTGAMRKALNRERTHVGRTAYADRVKSILLASRSQEVARLLSRDLSEYHRGMQHDETKYTEIATHASKILNASESTVFVTPQELQTYSDAIDLARRDGHSVTVVPESVGSKIDGMADIEGRIIRNVAQYLEEFSQSFKFELVDPEALTVAERRIYDKTGMIFDLIGGRPKEIKTVAISETMRPNSPDADVGGVWEWPEARVVIKRSQLQDLESYAGTLLHEAAHALSGASDVSREFELSLTHIIGKICSRLS